LKQASYVSLHHRFCSAENQNPDANWRTPDSDTGTVNHGVDFMSINFLGITALHPESIAALQNEFKSSNTEP
jgi:hypothetical protein